MGEAAKREGNACAGRGALGQTRGLPTRREARAFSLRDDDARSMNTMNHNYRRETNNRGHNIVIAANPLQ